MESKKKSLIEKISTVIIYRPWRTLIFGLLSLFFLASGLKDLTQDFSYRIWVRTTDPLIISFDAFEKKFGNDDSVIFVLSNEAGLFNREGIQTIVDLTKAAWQVPEIIRVDSLTNFQWTHAEGDDIIVEELFPEDPHRTENFIRDRKKIALKHEVLPNYLISKDGKMAMIFARVNPVLGGTPNYQSIVAGAKARLQPFKIKHPNYRFQLAGTGTLNDTFREVAEHDIKTLIPVLCALIFLFLMLFFRSLVGVLLPFVVIVAAVTSSLGFAGHIGIKFNNMLTLLPNTLTAICIADSIHLLVTFYHRLKQGFAPQEAAYRAFVKDLVPITLTSLSTTIGFFSLIPTELIPVKSLGLLAGMGTLFGLFYCIVLLGPLLSLSSRFIKPTHTQLAEPKKDHPSDLSLQTITFIKNFKLPLICIFSSILVGFVYLATLNEVNSNPYDFFNNEVPLKKTNDFLIKNIGGSAGPELVIDSGKIEGIKDPVFLEKLDTLRQWLENNPHISRTINIIDILKALNRSLHGDQQAYYKLPETSDAVAQQLFLYNMSLPSGMDLNNRISLDNRYTRVSILWDLQDSKSSLAYIDLIEKKAKKLGLNATVTGKVPLYQRMVTYVVETFFFSISMALVMVTILLIFIFRSPRLGLLSMLPNVFPLAVGAGAMTLLNKPIDMGTALVTSVCIGIAVDDTIHFLTNFNNKIKEGHSVEHALALVLTYTGPALITTTVILVCGFGVFIFAEFMPNYNFGILTALVLSTAVIADLILLPAILLTLYKDKKSAKIPT